MSPAARAAMAKPAARRQAVKTVNLALQGGGSHAAYTLGPLDALPQDRLRDDLSKGLDFLHSLGVETREWVLAYPYGGYDAGVMATAKALGCRMAFTVSVGVADLDRDDRLALPRLDTNDFPPLPTTLAP